jgi:pimeloyl-ACP methyl ester carboxylesterase
MLSIHGRRVSYRLAGRGPLLLLVHGIAGSSETWELPMRRLADRFTVLAPDLPGHGRSDPPLGDYSLGATASMLRDLLLALGHGRATLVGHSLGGGVVMQAAYQFPELCERLVLESSGGLGTEVSSLLRALSMPGTGAVMRLGFPHRGLEWADRAAGVLTRIGLRPSPSVREYWRSYRALADAEVRRSFLRTLRAVVGPRGQLVSATDRLYLTSEVPSLIVWGRHDRIIPADHALAAHRAMPGSKLVLLPGLGHFPHAEDPDRFADVVSAFVAGTQAARFSRRRLRRLVREGTPAARAKSPVRSPAGVSPLRGEVVGRAGRAGSRPRPRRSGPRRTPPARPPAPA